MNSKVDKLFKDKLETHALQPSAQAWEKVESHLVKKNKMVVWLRVAAAVALLGSLAFVALEYSAPEKELVQKTIKPQEKPTALPDEKKEELKEELKQVAKAPVQKKARPVQREQSPKAEATNTVEQPIALVEEAPQEAPQEVKQDMKKIEKSITLVYSLPAIKKEQPAEPAVAAVKKTGFERVLEIAKEVKNADNPLGELREAKDDILAFEFRKDKDKNKKHN